MTTKKYSREEIELMRKLLLEYLNARESLEREKEEKSRRTLTRKEAYLISLNLPWYTDIVVQLILCFLGIIIIVIICLIYC